MAGCVVAGLLLRPVVLAFRPVREVVVAWPAGIANETDPVDATAAGAFGKRVPRVLRVVTDFQCPACLAFEQRVGRALEPLERDGQLRIVHIDAPLRGHPRAGIAAAVHFCATRSAGRTVEARVRAAVFAGSRDWAGTPEPEQRLFEIAALNGGDTSGVRTCLATDGAALVERGRSLARAMGVNAVPAVFLDDARLSFPSWSSLLRHIRRRVAR